MSFRSLVLLAVFCVPAFSAAGQASDDGARVEKIADGVYAILHDDATVEWPSGSTDWPHGNTTVVVGRHGVLVVDTTYLPVRAERDIALIRRLTDKPVRWIVNTHWHGDHTHGNGVYRKAFPGVTIIGARENGSYIDLNLVRAPRASVAQTSGTRTVLAELEKQLAEGRQTNGEALTPQLRTSLEKNVAQRRTQLEELAKVENVAPDLLFDGAMNLDLGSKRVEIRNEGRANSPADVSVYLPDEQVLATGDILVLPVPYAMQSHPTWWLQVIKRLETVPVKAIVPGHGPVLRDHSYTRKVRHLLETTLARVEAKAREGLNNDAVQTAVDLSDVRPLFVLREDDATAVAFWDYSILKTLIERSWACLVGYRC